MHDVFVLYRPSSEPRAQSVQVVSSAHALARRGHRVELCLEGGGSAERVLEAFGLAPTPGLRLRILPAAATPASLGYRAAFLAFVARTGGRGLALARRKRHAAEALSRLRGRFHLLLEAHEVDSLQAAERGEDPGPWAALEREVLRSARGVICNAPGTLELLRRAHPVLPPAVVIHNAARPAPPPRADAAGVGIFGSVRDYKDPETVARAAALLGAPVTWIGVDPARASALEAASGGWLRALPPVPYREVPEAISRFRVLVLPLSGGLFGERLTSPLKLWDGLASGVPLVAADTAAIRLAAPGATVPYRPGDPASLARAITRAQHDLPLRAAVTSAAAALARTWDDRAAEVERFLDRVAP